jgi:hypothetical protein
VPELKRKELELSLVLVIVPVDTTRDAAHTNAINVVVVIPIDDKERTIFCVNGEPVVIRGTLNCHSALWTTGQSLHPVAEDIVRASDPVEELL